MGNTFRIFSFMDMKTTSAVRFQVNLTVQNRCVVTHRAVGKLLNNLKEIGSLLTSRFNRI
jgi:hypothetical protein